jgi:integrase
MVFKSKHAHTYKIKLAIPTRNGERPRTFSLGTTSREVAKEIERTIQRMKGRREWAALELVFDGLATFGDVYDADLNGTVAALIARLRDTDLDPLATEWAEKANARYVSQVRRFIVEGERFPASEFRRKRISTFLAGLDVDDPTRNRYRAAISVFGKWLVEREVLDANPVRDVAMYREHDPRMVWMTWADAIKVSDAAAEPYATLFRLMAATGIELGAALTLTRQDVQLDERTIAAHGSKTSWRNRVVRFEEWATFNLTQLCKPLVGFAPLFPGIRHHIALQVFKAAQKAVGITGHRIHDLRHTYAVNALRKGYKPTVVATQLGHKNASMVIKCYGRFIPDASDYEVGSKVTNSATNRKKRGEVKRAN